MLPVVLITFALLVRDASAVVVYRIGTPFSAAEKDSLDARGIDVREIEWSVSQLQEALELDSLQAGFLQPNFFAEDEDIASTLFNRDGWVGIVTFMDNCNCVWNKQVGEVLVDEDPTTGWTWSAVPAESFSEAATRSTIGLGVLLDLGGRFLLREVRLRPLADHPEQFLESYDMGVSDRGFNTYRIPVFPPVVQVRENTEPEVSMTIDPPVTTEAIHLKVFRDTPKAISIAAVEVFGGGFVSQASYESDVIELDDIASWGEMSWSGRRDPGAQVEIRTRSGSDPTPEIYWETRVEQQDSVRFLQGGGYLSLTEYKRQYGKLSDFRKPGAPEDRVTVDIENWSFWSAPYDFENPGVDVRSPDPRRYLQIRADFTSTTEDGGKIDYIEFTASVPPAVHRLLGEIFPIETEVGESTRFTYFIRPTIRSGDSSFDGVEISTPSGVVSVDSLRIDAVDQQDFSWTIDEDGLGFELKLPRKLEPTDSGGLVEVVFTAPVLREVGTLFEGRVFDTSKPSEVRQQIIPGNALDDIASDRVSVTASLSGSLLFSPRVSPNPFTPNGDGVNDVVNISYKLLRVTSAVPVSIEIFDLSGRLIRQVYAGNDPLGEYSYTWDGTGNSNDVVQPGLYVCRIVADVQSKQESTSGVLSVAY